MPETLDVEALSMPGPTDREAPNGSSIAFVAEYEGRRVLMGGDAHPDLLAKSLAALAEAEGGRYRMDLLKVPHHGSRGNVTADLIRLLDCRRFAISIDGTRHGHPDPEAIARLLRFSPEGTKRLYFNYAKDRALAWNAEATRGRWGYDCVWPDPEQGVLEIDIDERPDGD